VKRVGARTEEIGPQTPGDLEILEVLGVDLLERRVAVACKVAAVRCPVGRSRRFRWLAVRDGRGQRNGGAECDNTEDGSSAFQVGSPLAANGPACIIHERRA